MLSAITYVEPRCVAAQSNERARAIGILEELTRLIPIERLTAETAAAYGSIRAALAHGRALIGNNDLWIAPQAQALNQMLVTTREREFRRVPGIKVENWAAVDIERVREARRLLLTRIDRLPEGTTSRLLRDLERLGRYERRAASRRDKATRALTEAGCDLDTTVA